jgi:hypothetical protein
MKGGMKIPIDIKEHKDKEKKKFEKIRERDRNFSQEVSKAEELVLEFLKTNQGKAFTAEELYNLFTWKYIDADIIYIILEKNINHSKSEGFQILEPYDREKSKFDERICRYTHTRYDKKSFHFFWKKPKSRNKKGFTIFGFKI